jgi:hypothetical protein
MPDEACSRERSRRDSPPRGTRPSSASALTGAGDDAAVAHRVHCGIPSRGPLSAGYGLRRGRRRRRACGQRESNKNETEAGDWTRHTTSCEWKALPAFTGSPLTVGRVGRRAHSLRWTVKCPVTPIWRPCRPLSGFLVRACSASRRRTVRVPETPRVAAASRARRPSRPGYHRR